MSLEHFKRELEGSNIMTLQQKYPSVNKVALHLIIPWLRVDSTCRMGEPLMLRRLGLGL